MRVLRVGSVVITGIVATVCVACGSSSDDAPAPGSTEKAWSDTTSALGVTSWAEVPSDDDSFTVTGYDDAHVARAQFVVDHGQDSAGNATVRIRSVIQGPAVLEYRGLPEQKLELLQDTFRDHADAKRALELAQANLKVPAAASNGSLVTASTPSLNLQDNAPLIGNQEQLICKDAKGNACTKPPDMGGITGVGAGCVSSALGIVGVGCLVSGVETIGVGCILSAAGGLYGAYTCADGLGQRANCKCVTPCAQQCQQTYNRQYMCAPNSRSCSDAVANDRAQEASCTSACGK